MRAVPTDRKKPAPRTGPGTGRVPGRPARPAKGGGGPGPSPVPRPKSFADVADWFLVIVDDLRFRRISIAEAAVLIRAGQQVLRARELILRFPEQATKPWGK